ncbi:LLM class F420-dependent oxidoreductase, partial [Nocardia salmonicida]|uniref:LLM class F420-dependent oxidoreductase n=1 Tax=Nocardia salmonicida TaxID=53431 RepID=UPI0033D484FF
MKFGVNVMCTDETIQPPELAVIAEGLGFESVFFPEHTHVPVNRQVWTRGDGLPPAFHRTLDPMTCLTTAAMATTTIRLGTAVCLVAQHDPIVLAKQLATIDRASGGRILFGVGAGSNREEAANHGIDPRQRYHVMDEKVQAIKALWTQDEAEFHGQHVDFDPVYSFPKPLQNPHPPILVGGVGPSAHERVLLYGDSWFPTHKPGQDLSELAERISARLRRGRRPRPGTRVLRWRDRRSALV